MKTMLPIAMACFLVGCSSDYAPNRGSSVSDGFSEEELTDALSIRVKRLDIPSNVQRDENASFVLARLGLPGERVELCRHQLEGASRMLFALIYPTDGSLDMRFVVHSVSYKSEYDSSSKTSDGVLGPPYVSWSVQTPRFLEDMQAYELACIRTPTNQVPGLIYWFE